MDTKRPIIKKLETELILAYAVILANRPEHKAAPNLGAGPFRRKSSKSTVARAG